MSHGGIQVEWYYSGTEIEIDIPPAGVISVLIVQADGRTNEETVDDLDDPIWSGLHSVILGLK